MDDIGVCQAGRSRSGTRFLSRCGLPRILGRSASTTVLSRPAGRSPYPAAWVATGMNRQFPGRDFHPLAICALVAHLCVVVVEFAILFQIDRKKLSQ